MHSTTSRCISSSGICWLWKQSETLGMRWTDSSDSTHTCQQNAALKRTGAICSLAESPGKRTRPRTRSFQVAAQRWREMAPLSFYHSADGGQRQYGCVWPARSSCVPQLCQSGCLLLLIWVLASPPGARKISEGPHSLRTETRVSAGASGANTLCRRPAKLVPLVQSRPWWAGAACRRRQGSEHRSSLQRLRMLEAGSGV